MKNIIIDWRIEGRTVKSASTHLLFVLALVFCYLYFEKINNDLDSYMEISANYKYVILMILLNILIAVAVEYQFIANQVMFIATKNTLSIKISKNKMLVIPWLNIVSVKENQNRTAYIKLKCNMFDYNNIFNDNSLCRNQKILSYKDNVLEITTPCHSDKESERLAKYFDANVTNKSITDIKIASLRKKIVGYDFLYCVNAISFIITAALI